MSYKVYFSARYSRRRELADYRTALAASDVEVTSRWITDDPPVPVRELTEQHWQQLAEKDLADIARADAVVAFTEAPGGGNGGRHVELGVGVGLKKAIVIVGEPEHLFHRLDGAHRVKNWPAAIQVIKRLALRSDGRPLP